MPSVPAPPAAATATLGVVRYLNAQPLVRGLADGHHARLTFDVPSALLDRLLSGAVDLALLPVADLLARPGRLRIVSDAIIGADDSSLTVKLFAQAPAERLTEIAVDPDSHSSVALLNVLCRHCWRNPARFVPLPRSPEAWSALPACLLIGDKVITDRPSGFAYEYDLATVWRAWTGLPFVFAAWVARKDDGLPNWRWWAAQLSQARDRGVADVEAIVAEQARPRGWPADLARDYFTRHLRYTLTPAHRRGLARFLRLLRAQRPVDAGPRG